MSEALQSLEAALYPIVVNINTYLSSYILVFLLIGVGLFYSIRTRFVQVRCFGEGMKKVFGNVSLRGGRQEQGMSSFQALATAIAAQVGTGNIVGGHQRLKVLVQKGYTEVQVVEVELNEQEERILNVSLNKISGRWDNEKLTAILDELKEQDEMALTGFEDWELDALKVTYDHIEDLLNEDFSDTGKSEPNSYTMTFTLPEEVHEAMDKYIDENPAGKVELAQLLVNKAKGLI